MVSYKQPSFAERTAAALEAKQKALEKLRNKPAMDPEVVAQRKAAADAKAAAAAEARRLKIEEREAAKAEKRAAAEAAAAAAAEAEAKRNKPLLNAEELKAARDARYAARKARKN